MQRVLDSVNYPPAVGKVRDTQVAHQSTWRGIPDDDTGSAAFYQVHVTPSNASTCTYVNPLDPAQQPGRCGWQDGAVGWDKVPQNSWRKF